MLLILISEQYLPLKFLKKKNFFLNDNSTLPDQDAQWCGRFLTPFVESLGEDEFSRPR